MILCTIDWEISIVWQSSILISILQFRKQWFKEIDFAVILKKFSLPFLNSASSKSTEQPFKWASLKLTDEEPKSALLKTTLFFDARLISSKSTSPSPNITLLKSTLPEPKSTLEKLISSPLKIDLSNEILPLLKVENAKETSPLPKWMFLKEVFPSPK